MNNYSISTNSILYNFGNASTDQPECKSFIAPSSVSSQVVMTTAYCVLLLSLVGNSLVVIVFLKPSGRPRTPVDYFIVNMSVSDLFIPLFTILRRLQEIYLGWSPWLIGGLIRDLLCRFINFVEEVSIAVSMLSMVFIAVERFWSVVYPLKLPLITKKTSPRFVAFSWIFAILTFSYYFVAYKLVVKNDQLYCQYVLPQVFDTWQDLWRADRIKMFVIYVAVPFVLLTILYTVIVVSLHQQEKRAFNLHSNQQRRRMKQNKQITLMLAIVVLLFFISWTPHYMYFFVRYYFWPPEQRWSCSSIKRLYLAAMYMNYLYTALNPFIYYIFIDSYRRSFQAIFGCNKLRVAAAKSSIGYALRSTNNQQTELESNLSASTVYLSSKRIYSKISSIESALQEAGMKIKSMSKTVEDANMHEY